jgi:histidinol-phosphate/aromatic aminotransferase/cobyric acid decarboxylase-like protein
MSGKLESYLRISVGTEIENEKALNNLEKILPEL